MKQTLFMLAATLVGTLGVFVGGPFPAVAVYYLFAVLRPQYLWQWALPDGIPWSQFVAVAAMVGAVGLLTGMLPGGGESRPFRGLSRTQRVFLAFALWVCFTYFTAQHPDVAWRWLLEYLKIFAMFFVASLVIRDIRQVWITYILATVSLVYIAYEMNFLYLVNHRMDIYHNGYGGLDNNGAGLMLAIGFPMALYAWEGSARWWRWAFLLAIPIILHSVLLSFSRGAMVSLLVVAPLIVFRARRRRQFGVVALAVALSIPVLAGKEIRARFFTMERYDADASANSRFDSWRAAVRIAADFPIVGVGIRNSNLYSHSYGADQEGRTIHSQYLQLLADSGYPALLLYLGTILCFVADIRRTRRLVRSRDDPEARLVQSMLSGLECGMAVFCVGGAFLSLEVFELPYLVLLLGGQLAALTRASERLSPNIGAVAPVAAGG